MAASTRGPAQPRQASTLLQCLHLASCTQLRGVALRCVALRCVALRCVALRCVALRCVALRCVALRYAHFWDTWGMALPSRMAV